MSCPSCQSNNSGIALTTPCDCNCNCAEPICATPQPCTEIIDSKCVIYTDAEIKCGTDIIVPINSSVSTAMNLIANYFCQLFPTSLGSSISANGFKLVSCISDDIVLPDNSIIQYPSPLIMCAGNTLTIPLGTTLTII
jgi:hypothetical protein